MAGTDSGYAHTHLRMNDRVAKLKGSELRDLYKQLHKEMLPSHMTGCDLDFVIVEKNPDCIVAFKDVKRSRENVTFAEVIAYNALLRIAPLYLLYVDGNEGLIAGRFAVYRYLGGNRVPNPPVIRTELYARLNSWDEYRRWEQELRNATKQARANGNGVHHE
jgi:hypothetical protein